MPKRQALSPMQQRFVREYLIDLNAYQAAQRAGYSQQNSKRNSHLMVPRLDGSEVRGKYKAVQREIKKALLAREKRVEARADEVLRGWLNIARAAPTDVAEVTHGSVTIKGTEEWPEHIRAAVSEIRQTADGVVVKFHSKISALDSLARHLGMFVDRAENLNVNAGGDLKDILGEEEARDILARMFARRADATGAGSNGNGNRKNGNGNGNGHDH
jgi:phage terminase small subunit